jgi:hypothetical protein
MLNLNTAQPNGPSEHDKQRRAAIRARNAVEPRCSVCEGRVYGDTAELGAEAQHTEGWFEPGDILCVFCWHDLHQRPDRMVFWGRA